MEVMNNDMFSQNQTLVGQSGKTRASVARTLNISTRTLGRWIDKYGFNENEVQPMPEPVVEPVVEETGGKATNAEQARMYFKAGAYQKLWEFKKAKKKSWESLGFTAAEQDHIDANKPT